MSNLTKKRKHADFQDSYHRSSNFNKITKKEGFTLKGNGKLKLADSGNLEMSKTYKKKISSAMDSMRHRMDMTSTGDEEE
ncbi:hypothetical protein [Ulvibacter antarcticus]|uniref:Uncharacterized protein n=1 Tax=Ulvibacter antarcticus TaxID=442714 RepID=A0A3L9YYX9_9FLAO|nr:hypothetical protein [Ulvibacter antarcticus]RMA64279.1 hypothetical protein BXY75_1152 [Ulvibacter antarcticus]